MKAHELSCDEISGLCRALSLLLHAGAPLGDALALLANGEPSPALRPLLENMSRQADQGVPLSEIIRASGGVPD